MTATIALPPVRGSLKADAPLAPLVWFKAGGAAQWLFEPKDADDLSDFLAMLDPDVPVMALGLGSNLICPRWRGAGRATGRGDAHLWRRRVGYIGVIDRAGCGHCGA